MKKVRGKSIFEYRRVELYTVLEALQVPRNTGRRLDICLVILLLAVLDLFSYIVNQVLIPCKNKICSQLYQE